jgi:hypothetical protein
VRGFKRGYIYMQRNSSHNETCTMSPHVIGPWLELRETIHVRVNKIDAGSFSSGVKRPEREANHSSPSSAEVKNAWSYT